MKNLLVLVVAVVLAIGAAVFLSGNGADAAKKGLTNDHALFDTTGPTDTGASCTGKKEFELFGSFRAFGGPAVLRVTFADDDLIDYPIPADTSFSLDQAAGGTQGVDDVIAVTAQSGDIVGWLSARGVGVSCTTSTSV